MPGSPGPSPSQFDESLPTDRLLALPGGEVREYETTVPMRVAEEPSGDTGS